MSKALRTWGVVDSPENVEGIRDNDGDLWRPCTISGWQNFGSRDDAWRATPTQHGDPWAEVLRYAPLREVTWQGEAIGAIVITDAMVAAADAESSVEMNAATIAATIAAALRAGGFEVAE